MKSLHGCGKAVLALSLIFNIALHPFARAASDDLALFREVRTRDRDTCAMVFHPAREDQYGDRIVDDSSGIVISKLDSEDFEKQLEMFLDELEKSTGSRELDGALSAAGLPMLDRGGNRALVEQIKDVLAKAGVRELPIRMFTVPQGTDAKRALQELLYFLPRPSDYQPPIAAEGVKGVSLTMASLLPMIADTVAHQPAKIAVPLIFFGVGTDVLFSRYRQSIDNWQNRTEKRLNGPAGEAMFIAERTAKQVLIADAVFIPVFYGTEHWPQFAQAVHDTGLVRATQTGLADFFSSQAITLVEQPAFFALVSSAALLWAKNKSKTAEGVKSVRSSMPFFYLMIFAVSNPLLVRATQGKIEGHIGLAILAFLGALLLMKPDLFDHAEPLARFLDQIFGRYVMEPIMRFRGRFKRSELPSGIGKEVIDVTAEPVDEPTDKNNSDKR